MKTQHVAVPAAQRGAALVSVIFLIVTVAALGTFAIRTGMDYGQQATLALQEVRADVAAYSGIEYAVNRLSLNPACNALPPGPLTFPGSAAGMTGIRVVLTCTASATQPSTGSVFEITARAQFGVFGNPDYVQRERTRRVGNVSGSWF
jgi:hypothetical protein